MNYMVQGGVFIVRGDFISILSPRTVSGGWSVPPDTIRDAADHIPPPPPLSHIKAGYRRASFL